MEQLVLERGDFEHLAATIIKAFNIFGHSNGVECTRSETDLGSSPVSSLGVVSDLVVSSISDPVWQSSVTLNLVTDLDFSTESFY